MKKQLLTLLFAISTVISFSQVPSYVPTNGLVGYWPFNGNANDESGNGNNGTVNGATLTTDRFNSLNLAYHLDGNGDNIYVANSLFDNGSVGFSLSIWYNLDQFQNPNNGNSSHILFNTSPHNGLGLDMNWSGSSKYSIFLGNGTPANSWNTSIFNSESNQNIAINSWHNVVLVKSGNTYSLYIDGVFDINWISNTTISPYFYKMYFGAADPDVSNEVIIGDIDDIGIWNRILTQQEITDLYNSCSNPSATITPQGNTTFCQGGSVTLNATTGTNYTYEWFKDGSLINGAGSATYQANLSGNYTVKVIDGACNTTSSSTTVSVLNCASLMENNGDNTSIYPNPIKDMLNIESPFMDGNIILIDANGKTVIEMKIEDKKTKIDVKNIVPGTYNLIIKNKDQIIEKKIVKL